MTEIKVIDVPTITEIKIDDETKRKLLEQVKEEAQVIVHCSFTGQKGNNAIRIWNSTFLYSKDSSHKSKLLSSGNISVYPLWTFVPEGQTLNFTLIFTSLPKSCKYFDLVEDIPESGGFIIRNIERNNTDVYLLDMN